MIANERPFCPEGEMRGVHTFKNRFFLKQKSKPDFFLLWKVSLSSEIFIALCREKLRKFVLGQKY